MHICVIQHLLEKEAFITVIPLSRRNTQYSRYKHHPYSTSIKQRHNSPIHYYKRKQITKTIDSSRSSSDLLFFKFHLQCCHFRVIPTTNLVLFDRSASACYRHRSAGHIPEHPAPPSILPLFRFLASPQSTHSHSPSGHPGIYCNGKERGKSVDSSRSNAVLLGRTF